MPADQFALWAIAHSVIFILLLWTDFGLKKSVLRFFPELRAEKELYVQRLCIIGIVRMLTLIGTIPLIYCMVQHYNKSAIPFWVIAGIYSTEGVVQFLQCIYHAQFLNKAFNLFRSLFLILETGISLSAIVWWHQTDPLPIIFYTKIASSTICGIGLVGLLFVIKPVLKETYYITEPFCWYLFIRHASIMWITGVCKSLSERNIVVPLLATTLGTESASIFKVAQDGALFFQRTIIKTFGSAAISYLSYRSSDDSTMAKALEKVCKTTSALSIPLALFILFIGSILYRSSQPIIIELFLILLFFYLIELLFFSYETFLEVNYYYQELLCSYIPYCIGIIGIGYMLYTNHIMLIAGTIALNSARCASMLCMIYATHTKIIFVYPYTYALSIIRASVTTIAILMLTL